MVKPRHSRTPPCFPTGRRMWPAIRPKDMAALRLATHPCYVPWSTTPSMCPLQSIRSTGGEPFGGRNSVRFGGFGLLPLGRFFGYTPRLAVVDSATFAARSGILGEVSERLKEPVSKTGVRVTPYRGFESPPLRLKLNHRSPLRLDFQYDIGMELKAPACRVGIRGNATCRCDPARRRRGSGPLPCRLPSIGRRW